MKDRHEMIRMAMSKILWAKEFPFAWEFMSDFSPGQLIYVNGKVGRLLDKGINFIRVKYGNLIKHHYKPGTITPEMEEMILDEKQNKTKAELADEFRVTPGRIDYALYVKNSFSMVYWTEEEDELLKKHRDKGTLWLSKKLGKKTWDVNNRIVSLGLGMIRNRWTKKQDKKLAKMYKNKTTKELALIFGMSEKSIRGRIAALRNRGEIDFVKGSTREWKPDEEEQLMSDLGNISYAEIAEKHGRSLSSVKSKIQSIYRRRRRGKK